ncbi:hypothetical protein Syun_019555 [Stephania yunnanensis]|uniref:Uncharacterized protein n=1 Tax=Stephania yunnanensis TaxID=152371 RepID=A0AAP0IW08_9MAGN
MSKRDKLPTNIYDALMSSHTKVKDSPKREARALFEKLFGLPKGKVKCYSQSQLSKVQDFDVTKALKELYGGFAPKNPKKPSVRELTVFARFVHRQVAYGIYPKTDDLDEYTEEYDNISDDGADEEDNNEVVDQAVDEAVDQLDSETNGRKAQSRETAYQSDNESYDISFSFILFIQGQMAIDGKARGGEVVDNTFDDRFIPHIPFITKNSCRGRAINQGGREPING